jgi:hypothetical protein
MRPEGLGGRRIIAPRRSNSAHLHRPWRASFSYLQRDMLAWTETPALRHSSKRLDGKSEATAQSSRRTKIPRDTPLSRLATADPEKWGDRA